MSDPFQVLDLPASADESRIRQRYLQLVREFPPDRDAERFAEIRAAYDEIRDPKRVLERRLFSLGSSETLPNLIVELRRRLQMARLPVDELLALAELP